jgi:TRAP transporter TAXI family solute receptor
MKRIRYGIAGALMGACVAIAGTVAAETFRFGAMPVGSGWYVAAAAIEKVITPALEGQTVEIIPRGGGVANPMVVENGGADIAFANVQTAVLAMNGDPELYEGQKAENIRALVGGLNPVYIGAMVRRDFIERTGLDTLEKILESDEAVRILMKPPGSNIPPAVDVILAAHGTDRDEIRANGGDIIQVDTAQIPAVLRDARADVLFDTILRGHPMITEVALTGDVEFLDLSDKAQAALAQVGVRPASFPAWFEGQTGETKSGDFGTVLIGHADVPDDVAYAVTKAVIENMDEISAEYPAYSNFKAEDAWKPENTGIPLHPGAERYYKERGWM